MMPENRIEVEEDPLQYLYSLGWRPLRSVKSGTTNTCPFCSADRKKIHQKSVCCRISIGDYYVRATCYHENISYLVVRAGFHVREDTYAVRRQSFRDIGGLQ